MTPYIVQMAISGLITAWLSSVRAGINPKNHTWQYFAITVCMYISGASAAAGAYYGIFHQ